MTNERAKEVLQEQIDRYGQEYDAEGIEALETAIKVLEQTSCKSDARRWKRRYLDLKQRVIKLEEQQPCEDCISREDAVDIINGYAEQFNGYIGTPNDTEVYAYVRGLLISIERNISALPSAQPELEKQPCEDYIKRADVLKYAQLIRDDEGIVHEMVHVDDIKDASSVTWSGWTPATQLPEPSTAVLLHVKYKSNGQRTYQLGMWNDNKQAWEDWRTPYQLEEEFEVIAWMELPEKYEEDNHE